MLFDYKCNKCDFKDEFSTSPSVPKDMNPPEKCPKCGKGKLERQWGVSGQSHDIIGYCYENVYGKKGRLFNDPQHHAAAIGGHVDPY